MLLAGCGKSGSTSSNSGAKDARSSQNKRRWPRPRVVAKILSEETDTPFTGIFLDELVDSQIDSDVSQFALNHICNWWQYKINNKVRDLPFDRKAKTVTIEVKKGVKWSDGKQVTAKDAEYAYEIIANKDSGSSRYIQSRTSLDCCLPRRQGQDDFRDWHAWWR